MNVKLWQGRFREYMELRSWSPRTMASYAREVRPFFEFLEGQAVRSLSGITRDALEAYRGYLFYLERGGRRLKAATQASRLIAVKAFVRFLVHEQFLLIDPGAAVDLPRVPETLPRVLLSETEVAQLIESVDVTEPLGVRDRALLEFLYSTALRNAEVCELTCDDLSLVTRTVTVWDGKGGQARMVPLGEEAALWLDAWLRRGRPVYSRDEDERGLFLSFRGRPLDRSSLTEMVGRRAEEAGLALRVTPHALRHACATHMLARGAGLRHLQLLLGHASTASTQRYARVEISDLREVHQRCHPRERGMLA